VQTLIYCSRQAIAPVDLDHEVGAIIAASIRNNRAAAVTGLLLIHAGWFVQALEGPAAAVEQTFQRIVDDHRHRESRVLVRAPAKHRSFASWNMCARRITPADDAIIATLSQRGNFDPSRFTGEAAMRLLLAVRDIQERTQRQALT
jgi:hypothetical protein